MYPDEFLKLADALPAALILLSGDGEVLAANRQAQRMLGDSLRANDGSNLYDLVSNSAVDLTRMLRTWSRSRSPVPASISWKTPPNSANHSLSYQAFLLEPASSVDSAKLVLSCIPGRGSSSEFDLLNRELKKLQGSLRKLRSNRQELERERELAMVTLHSIADAVITTDKAGRIEYLNPVAETLTGWTSTEANGKNSREVFNIIDEITRLPAADPVSKCLSEKRAIELGNHTVLMSRDGSEYIVEDTVSPIRNQADEIFGAVLIFRDVTSDRLARKQLEYLSQHDTLTGLHNRYYFEQRLNHAVDVARRGELSCAMLYIDLDHFKTVNDIAGHSAGDQLLAEVAAAFSRRLRLGDTLARLCGDEFGVLLENIKKEEVANIADSYRNSLQGVQFNWKGKCINLTPTIGISLIDSETISSAEVMRQADIACYVAKHSSRNCYHHYCQDDDAKVPSLGDIDLLSALRDALANDRFVLYYQPIARCSGISIEMYETLIRLIRDDGSLVAPNVFIPVAERHGLMTEVDRWVVQNVLRVLQDSHQGTDRAFAINLSGTSFGDKKLLELLKDLTANNEQLARSVIFEVTETSAVRYVDKAGAFMRALGDMGIRFALDDFGTGFSSFAYLKHLPVDFIKIDGMFIRDIVDDQSDQAMVRSINQIGHSLGKQTIAEYVENAQILDKVREIGVDLVQGYHIGKPCPELPRPPQHRGNPASERRQLDFTGTGSATPP